MEEFIEQTINTFMNFELNHLETWEMETHFCLIHLMLVMVSVMFLWHQLNRDGTGFEALCLCLGVWEFGRTLRMPAMIITHVLPRVPITGRGLKGGHQSAPMPWSTSRGLLTSFEGWDRETPTLRWNSTFWVPPDIQTWTISAWILIWTPIKLLSKNLMQRAIINESLGRSFKKHWDRRELNFQNFPRLWWNSLILNAIARVLRKKIMMVLFYGDKRCLEEAAFVSNPEY